MVEGLPPEKQPIASLEALEQKSKKMALNGLRQAINDCVEMSSRFDPAEVQKLDSQLRSHGIVTLSELRRRYSKGYAKIVNGPGSKTRRSTISSATCLTIRRKRLPKSANCLKRCFLGMRLP